MQTVAKASVPVSSSQSEQSSKAWIVAACSTALAFSAVLGISIWGLDKGFDPNIEGFYMLSYQHPELYPTFSAFHLLLSKIPHLAQNEIIHYRLLELIARIIPPAVLALAATSCAQRLTPISSAQKAFIVFATCLGSMYSQAVFPRIISYNGLAAAFIFLSAAMASFARAARMRAEDAVITSETEGATLECKAKILVVVAGTLAGLTLLVKFTSGICLLPVLLLLTCTRPRASTIFLNAFLLTIGIAISGIGFFALIQNPVVWWSGFSEAVALEAKTSHQLGSAMAAVLEFAKQNFLYAFVATAFGVGLRRFLFSENSKQVNDAFAVLCAIIPLFFVLLSLREYNVSYATIGVLAILAIALLPLHLKEYKSNWTSLILGLSALPALATFGTNNDFFLHMESIVAPLFLVIALGSIVCAKKYQSPILVLLIPMVLVVSTTSQFISRYISQRYECDPLTEQTVAVRDIPLLNGIKLRPIEVEFYSAAQKLLREHGFQKGDKLLCLYDFPGLNYALDATSPGQAWYVSWPDRDTVNATYLSESTIANDDRFFLMVMAETPRRHIGPAVLKSLADHGCKFPDTFEEIGRMPSIYAKPDFNQSAFFYKHQSKRKNSVL